MAAGFGGLVEVEGFLGVPAFDVGTHCLVRRDFGVDTNIAFVKLATFHVEVCDFDFDFLDFRVEVVGDEEAFEVAAYSLVEAVETYCGNDLSYECDGVGREGDDGIGGFGVCF